jgi:hypothetical protein
MANNSYPPLVIHSGGDFQDEHDFRIDIRNALLNAKHHCEIVYNNIAPNWVSSLDKASLDKDFEEKSAR